MKRLDINVTDSISTVLDGLKRRTERSKTELVHDAIGLLGIAQKTYERGYALAEVDERGTVIARIHMPMFAAQVDFIAARHDLADQEDLADRVQAARATRRRQPVRRKPTSPEPDAVREDFIPSVQTGTG